MWGKILFKDLVVLKKIVRFIGMSMAKKMIFTWDKVKAEESLRIGIVNSIYSQNELLNVAKKLALSIAKN